MSEHCCGNCVFCEEYSYRGEKGQYCDCKDSPMIGIDVRKDDVCEEWMEVEE